MFLTFERIFKNEFIYRSLPILLASDWSEQNTFIFGYSAQNQQDIN